MSKYEAIKLDIANGVATLTLHRPDRMNAFTEQMMHEMIAAFDETDANDDVRAVIVTGEGRASAVWALELVAGEHLGWRAPCLRLPLSLGKPDKREVALTVGVGGQYQENPSKASGGRVC